MAGNYEQRDSGLVVPQDKTPPRRRQLFTQDFGRNPLDMIARQLEWTEQQKLMGFAPFSLTRVPTPHDIFNGGYSWVLVYEAFDEIPFELLT